MLSSRTRWTASIWLKIPLDGNAEFFIKTEVVEVFLLAKCFISMEAKVRSLIYRFYTILFNKNKSLKPLLGSI